MTRRRFRVDPETAEVYEVGLDDVQPSRTPGAPVTDLYMDGTRSLEGVDIGSRTKRRAYMKANGLADFDDMKGVWAKAEKQRAEVAAGTHDRKARREVVERAVYAIEQQRKNR